MCGVRKPNPHGEEPQASEQAEPKRGLQRKVRAKKRRLEP